MRVLVTGGAGFIGSHVVSLLTGRAEVVVLDDFSTGRRNHPAMKDCEVHEGSICDSGAVRAAMRDVDTVIHLAAWVSVPSSMADPLGTAERNVHGLLTTMQAARESGAKRFVFASSAAVYGENPEPMKTEDARPDPRSPYAITKLDGELYGALFQSEGWLQTVSLRFFNVFGPGQSASSTYAAAVAAFMHQAIHGDTIRIDGDGLQTRDFIYVKDIASALVFAAQSGSMSGVYNVGYGKPVTILALARKILELTGSTSQIVHGPARAGDIRHSTCDPSRLLAAGWKPAYDLDSGLAEMTA